MPTKKPTPTSRDNRVTVLLTDDERERLDAIASERGISRSDVLRSTLRDYQAPTIRRDA